MDRINRGKEIIADKLDLPKDVMLNKPKIIILGRNEVTIENHKGILSFEEKIIRINSSEGPIAIKGEKFEILYIATSTITISGIFAEITYER